MEGSACHFECGDIIGNIANFCYKILTLSFLRFCLQLLRTLAEPSMLCVILRHAQQLIPYYACYPKIAKAFIKVTVIT